MERYLFHLRGELSDDGRQQRGRRRPFLVLAVVERIGLADVDGFEVGLVRVVVDDAPPRGRRQLRIVWPTRLGQGAGHGGGAGGVGPG